MALLILSAASGTGKSTVSRRLLSKRRNLSLSVSHTTREPRTGEVDGIHYHFISKSAFRDRIAKGEFAEWAEYVGHYYGTSKAVIDDATTSGLDLLFDIEIQGAAQLKEAYPNAVSCFLLAPSWAELKRRLANRGTDEPGAVRMRLRRGEEELASANSFDYLVVNAHLDDTVAQLIQILETSKYRCTEQAPLIERLLSEAQADVK